jgi:phospholipid transport system substrate-binding protein
MIPRLPIILVIVLLVTAPARAATPLDYTRMILQQARSIVAANQSHNQKLAALSILFGKFLDSDKMGREALGQHWSSLTPAQQKQFLGLFRRLLQRTYLQTLLLFQNPDFVYAGQQFAAGDATVDTKIVTPRDQFDVTYTLTAAGDKWLATAITVEGVNLTENLANQFNHLLTRMTVDDMLALMRRKYGDSSEETST